MESNEMAEQIDPIEACGFKVGQRVRRLDVKGPLGTVKKVRLETIRTTIRTGSGAGDESPSITVTVLWDNGTLSHFVPDTLERM